MKAWRSAASFDPSRELGPWLATIARRTAIDVHRQEARRRAERLSDMTAGTEPSVVSLPPGVERAYDVWAVREAIASLPPEEQDVVRLQHVEELSHGEIAERLAVPVGTVKSRSFRAHRRLAARLGPPAGRARMSRHPRTSPRTRTARRAYAGPEETT